MGSYAKGRRGIVQSLGLSLYKGGFARRRATHSKRSIRAGRRRQAGPAQGAYTLNEVPQPQVVLALGLLNTNPLPFKPPE